MNKNKKKKSIRFQIFSKENGHLNSLDKWSDIDQGNFQRMYIIALNVQTPIKRANFTKRITHIKLLLNIDKF